MITGAVLLILSGVVIGFWFGQRARVARMHWIGVIVIGEDGRPAAAWREPVVPLHASLYVDKVDVLMGAA